jgi:Fur family transcriptional regulator, peroxide stress response regulator
MTTARIGPCAENEPSPDEPSFDQGHDKAQPSLAIYQVVDRDVKRPNNVKANRGRELGPSSRPPRPSRARMAPEELSGSMIPAPLTHEQLRRALEAAGLRCTPQRLAVYDQLGAGLYHPTAEEVFHAVRVKIPKISLATVYKSLEALVAIGAATRLTAADGTSSARYDARSEDHYHFRCLRTGAVSDLPARFDPDLIAKLDPHLEEALARQGFKVTGYRLELLGYRQEEPEKSQKAEAPHNTMGGFKG